MNYKDYEKLRKNPIKYRKYLENQGFTEKRIQEILEWELNL